MTTATHTQLLNHLSTIKSNPDVKTIRTNESIHRDEFDTFHIAVMNNGDQFVVGYSDLSERAEKNCNTFPLSEVPLVVGKGCWIAMSDYYQKQREAA